jgi:hypothetical protein
MNEARRDHHSNQTEDQKQNRRQTDRKRYANMPKDQKQNRKQTDRKRYASMPEDQLHKKNQARRDLHANMPEDQRHRTNHARRVKDRDRYTNQTEEQKQDRNRKDRERFKAQYYTAAELKALDEAGIPPVPSKEQRQKILNAAFERFNEDILICAVCNQFSPKSTAELHVVDDNLPDAIFTKLKPASAARPLHKLLKAEYDLSPYFPGFATGHVTQPVQSSSSSSSSQAGKEPDVRRHFSEALLSPLGICHENWCATRTNDKTACNCSASLCICNTCWRALKRKKKPRLSIANGNYVGQGPKACRDMSFGSRSCIRPIQQFGRMTSYDCEALPHGGTRITGHVYSNRLHDPLVATSIPLSTRQAPVRALVASSFQSKQTIIRKAELAKMKEDYLMQKEKMMIMIRHWQEVRHEILDKADIDESAIASEFEELPDNDVCPNMFLFDEKSVCTTQESSQVVVSRPPGGPTPVSSSTQTSSSSKDAKLTATGGPSLLYTNELLKEAIATSATVSLGADSTLDQNRQVAQALDRTYVVRASKTFVSDSDKDYAQTRYPDLFPYGRAGFDEPRDIKLSRETLLALWTNLGTRQFQKVDFVLPATDTVLRTAVSKKVFLRARLPSRRVALDGSVPSRAAAYGQIPKDDLLKVAAYKTACAEATDKGNCYISCIFLFSST